MSSSFPSSLFLSFSFFFSISLADHRIIPLTIHQSSLSRRRSQVARGLLEVGRRLVTFRFDASLTWSSSFSLVFSTQDWIHSPRYGRCIRRFGVADETLDLAE